MKPIRTTLTVKFKANLYHSGHGRYKITFVYPPPHPQIRKVEFTSASVGEAIRMFNKLVNKRASREI